MIEQSLPISTLTTTTQYLLKFASVHQLPHINKNNLHSYAPYKFDVINNKYMIDEKWYNGLTERTQKQLKYKFNIIDKNEEEEEENQYEHEQIVTFQYPYQPDKSYQYWEIYTWYNCQMYDFGHYVQDISEINGQDIYLVRFQNQKQKAQFSAIFFKQNPNLDQLQRLNTQIQKILTDHKNQHGYFVKLTQRSAKNQIKLFPARTVKDVYKNLIYSNDVKKQIYQSSGILLRQWKQFQKNNSLQFRVHVYQRRILAISPQYFKNVIDYKNINFTLLVKLLQQGIKKIQFANSFVIDVMFVNNQKLWFLEFNPYGVYAASRSGLFSHQEILELEADNQPPVIKILKK